VFDALRRLVRTGAAYQLAEIVAKFIALILLPVYTRHLTRTDYGTADLLLTLVILVSFLVRLGVVDGFVRHYYEDEAPEARLRLARAASGYMLLGTTAAALVFAALAGPLSELVIGRRDTTLFLIVALGLWTYSNLELANSMLRVDERAGLYLRASLSNVALTVLTTFPLVVIADQGARGLMIGNFAGSTLVLLFLWWSMRDRIGLRLDRGALAPMLRFGLPTVPAEMSVFALNLIDRLYLYRGQSTAEAGDYSLAVKLSAVVIFATRAFQFAWPPLAYSIRDDDEARRLYAFVTTYYALFVGIVVAGVTLEGRWVVRLMAAPEFFGAHSALPWVALGWSLYGFVLILVVMAGRALVTRRNFPAAIAGVAANVILLVTLVPPLGIAGAGIALAGAYVVMVAALYALTRGIFPVPFQWDRLVHLVVVMGGIAVAGELLAPKSGAAGFLIRAAAFFAIVPALALTGFFRADERARLTQLWRALRSRAPGGSRRRDPSDDSVQPDAPHV
jgi:O-antigen/teichoic acid export membrane protein